MAYNPGYGGSNGVPELDIGQKGSATRAAGTRFWVGKVTTGRLEQGQQINALPKQNAAFVEDLGFRGQLVTWVGRVKVVNATGISSLRSVLSQFHTGQAISAGVRGNRDGTYMKATRLVDSFNEVISATSRLLDYELGDWWTTPQDATFGYTARLNVFFRVLI